VEVRLLLWIGSRGASLGVDSNLLNLLRVYRVPFFGGGALSGRGAGIPPRCPPVQVASVPRLGGVRRTVVFTWHTDLPMTEGVQREDTP
jgi:hypothetical protein